MKLSDLTNDQIVTYRLGRYVETEHEPKWEPWRVGKLHLVRRTNIVPKSHRTRWNNWELGKIVTLFIGDGPDFGEADYDPKLKTFNCEDWYLQIKGLE